MIDGDDYRTVGIYETYNKQQPFNCPVRRTVRVKMFAFGFCPVEDMIEMPTSDWD